MVRLSTHSALARIRGASLMNTLFTAMKGGPAAVNCVKNLPGEAKVDCA